MKIVLEHPDKEVKAKKETKVNVWLEKGSYSGIDEGDDIIQVYACVEGDPCEQTIMVINLTKSTYYSPSFGLDGINNLTKRKGS